MRRLFRGFSLGRPSLRRLVRRNSVPLLSEVQSLEPRALLAGGGVVTASFTGNNLAITGDENNNDIAVHVSDTGIQVVGNGKTKIKVGSGALETEHTFAYSGAITGNVMIKLAGGNDDLTIDGTGFGTGSGTGNNFTINALLIDLGEGGDEFRFEPDGSATIKAAATFTGADGEDTIEVSCSETLTFSAALTVTAGDDGDDVVFSVDTLVVNGLTKIDTGDGEDFINLNLGTTTFKGLSVLMGGDDDEVRFQVNDSLTVNGDTSIVTGDCADEVNLTGSATTIQFNGLVSIDTGKGDDEVGLEMGSSGTAFNVTKDLKISTGTQSDSISSESRLVVGGSVILLTGSGEDSIDVRNNNGAATIGKDLMIDAGISSDFIGVSAEAPLTVTGKTTILSGAGGDFLSLFVGNGTTMTLNGDVTIDAGAHQDIVGIRAVDATLDVNGNLTITLGNEDDCLIFGAGDALANAIGAESVEGTGTVTIAKNLKIVAGTGDDVIAVAGLQEVGTIVNEVVTAGTGTVTLDLGEGTNSVGVEGVTVDRDVTVIGGSGVDTLNINDLTVAGKLGMDLKAGDDRLIVNDSEFNGSINILMGAGDDSVSIAGDVVVNAGQPIKIDGGANSAAGPKDNIESGVTLTAAQAPGFEGTNFSDLEAVLDVLFDDLLACYNRLLD